MRFWESADWRRGGQEGGRKKEQAQGEAAPSTGRQGVDNVARKVTSDRKRQFLSSIQDSDAMIRGYTQGRVQTECEWPASDSASSALLLGCPPCGLPLVKLEDCITIYKQRVTRH